MYRLKHFRATNLCGIMSGLGRKTLDLDLSAVYDKDIIAILGDNATGKSTFISLIHPIHTPSDKRGKFIIEGKEGSIIREYIGDDGTTIITKALYTPKKDGHTAKLFFKLIKDDEEVELNPSGNVASYNELIYTYMGVTKDYVAFASYNDLVRGIVDMTDTERKLNVASLIPNTKRFETAHAIINDKYRDLRNTIRNISQKITQLEDRDTLEGRLERLETSLESSRAERDKAIKKAAKLEGRLKEIAGDRSADELLKESRKKYSEVLDVYTHMMSSVTELKKLLFGLCRFNSDNLNELLKEGERQCEKIQMFETRYAKVVAERELYQNKIDQCRSQLSELETEVEELEATLYSLKAQDIEDLKIVKKELTQRLKTLHLYDPKDNRYTDLNYETAMSLANQVTLVQSTCQSLLERYGELFTAQYHGEHLAQELIEDTECEALLARAEREEEELYQEIARREQYRGLQEILEKRPASCVDDTCPFIAKALKWNYIQNELELFKSQHQKTREDIVKYKERLNNIHLAHQYLQDEEQLVRLMNHLSAAIKKYTLSKFDLMDVVVSLSSGDPKLYYDMQDELKHCAAVLSEKALYQDIVERQLPGVEASIKLAENSQMSRMMIEQRIEKATDKIEVVREQLNAAQISIIIIDDTDKHVVAKLDKLKRLRDLIRETDTATRTFADMDESYKKLEKAASQIVDIETEIAEYKEVIRVCDERIKEFRPAVDTTRYQLQQLAMLKVDEARESRNFMITNVIRSIVQPGKGIWKVAIDIYMSKINTIANQVLRNTFGGELTLEPFVLTDKSFFMPYVYNGSTGTDISLASSSQRATVATAISMAIISEMVDRYSTITLDEFDATLSPSNKEIVTEVLVNSMKILGIGTAYVITHNPENYEKAAVETGYILFPGAKLSGKKNKDYVEV